MTKQERAQLQAEWEEARRKMICSQVNFRHEGQNLLLAATTIAAINQGRCKLSDEEIEQIFRDVPDTPLIMKYYGDYLKARAEMERLAVILDKKP